tara:strand:+ start:2499 stop:2966 length:468 start_codon:yes stop_codon:yes gene_type:complete
MNINKIDQKNINISKKYSLIGKNELKFKNIKYGNENLIIKGKFSSFFGIQKDNFHNKIISLIPSPEYLSKIELLEKHIIENGDKDLMEGLTFKSIIQQYKEYDKYIKFTIKPETAYDKNIDYKKTEDISVFFTISGIYYNNDKYGISLKLNSLSL